ncbi:hypothetical protein AVEN_23427-1 [Araneus ventricosus]|uniref:Uncharacterized protein n=1 Tax=Araneus ventricosus TaxID=182803 RepID=A0A4Y2EA35_ARAVE|nr:hypothetical protein AVEN_23427-1 [Araneus ventricosus]
MTMKTSSEVQNNGFVQFIFDSADQNTRTVGGHGTFHMMEEVQCVTPASAVQTCSCIPPWNGARVCPTGGGDLPYKGTQSARPAIRGTSVMKLVSNFRQNIIYQLKLNTSYKNLQRREAWPPRSPSGAIPDSTTKDYTNGKYCWKVWIHPNRF